MSPRRLHIPEQMVDGRPFLDLVYSQIRVSREYKDAIQKVSLHVTGVLKLRSERDRFTTRHIHESVDNILGCIRRGTGKCLCGYS